MNENRHIDEELLRRISELFLTYGLRSTSMDDISTHLKISKKTLYQAFKNKDDVVEQVMLFRLGAKTKKEVMDSVATISPILFLYEMKKHIIEDLNTLLPANYFDLKKYHPEVYKRVNEKEKSFFHTMFRDLLQRGIDKNLFYKDLNISLQVYLLSGQLNILKRTDIQNSLEYSMPLLVSTIMDNFILAIVTSQGLKEFKESVKEENNPEKEENKK